MRWSGPCGIVGRVWPRHGQLGRPLNAVVRHQTMNVLANVFIWGVVGGAALGVALHYVVPSELRSKFARNFMLTGGMGILCEIVPFALSIDRPNLAPALTAVGITLVVFFLAGLVLRVIERRRSGV